MDSTGAVRAMVQRSGMSAREVSQAVGRSPDYLGGILYRGSSPSLATAAELAAPCGYAVALVPVADLPPSALVVDPRPTA